MTNLNIFMNQFIFKNFFSVMLDLYRYLVIKSRGKLCTIQSNHLITLDCVSVFVNTSAGGHTVVVFFLFFFSF